MTDTKPKKPRGRPKKTTAKANVAKPTPEKAEAVAQVANAVATPAPVAPPQLTAQQRIVGEVRDARDAVLSRMASLTLRQMATNALMSLKRELQPNPLPVGQVMGWLEERIDPTDHFAALTFLETLIKTHQQLSFGTGMLGMVEERVKLASNAGIVIDDPAPAMTAMELQQRVIDQRGTVVTEVPAGADTVSSNPAPAEGDGEGDTGDGDPPPVGLDSFVS